MADDVFVGVIDLLGIGILARAEGDQTGGESLVGEAVSVADLIIEILEAL